MHVVGTSAHCSTVSTCSNNFMELREHKHLRPSAARLPNNSDVADVTGEVGLRWVDDLQVPVLVDCSDLLDDQLAGELTAGTARAALFPVRALFFLVLCRQLVQLCHFLCVRNEEMHIFDLLSPLQENIKLAGKKKTKFRKKTTFCFYF